MITENSLIRPLASGSLDLIGDVHGELDALDALLGHLGYDREGYHPEGRRLIFLGDLCDRGPDSPGVFRRVQAMVKAGNAQCLLGNHELNLLRKSHKEGNGWFYPEAIDHDGARGKFLECHRLPEADREGLLDFIAGLPLALERDDLRVVHACWHAPSIHQLRASVTASAAAFYDASEARILDEIEHAHFAEAADREAALLEPHIADSTRQPALMLNLALRDEHYQNGNPVRAASSGIERVAREPFFTTGKWRMLERARWWEEYDDPIPVVFGHYWRVPAGMERPANKGIHDVFAGRAPTEWLGLKRAAMCIDYCVGARHNERRVNTTGYQTRLAALRWPEAELTMDDGSKTQTRPGTSLGIKPIPACPWAQ